MGYLYDKKGSRGLMGVLNTSAAVSSRPLAVSSPSGISTFSCVEGLSVPLRALSTDLPERGISAPCFPSLPIRSTTVGDTSSISS